MGSGKLTPEHFRQLPYTQNVINESLRLYPPAYVIGRQVDQDVQIGGYHLKKGDMVLISQYVMQRREEYFDHPDKFIPERFESNPIDSLPPFSYFPFGGGPRVCIGNHFALMEAVLVVATISKDYKLTLIPDHPVVRPQPLITLRPKGGLRMVIEKRNEI